MVLPTPRVPVTVLSRCLQFNLKQMPADLVTRHLKRILEAEQVTYETEALNSLARAAAGSMRDALSLTDQAIAYGQGQLKADETRAMLGAVDSAYLLPLLEALAVNDGLRLMAEAETIAERSLSFDGALQDLALLLHQIALIQVVPDAIDNDLPDQGRLASLAGQIDAETIQLYYQITTLGRRDLEWAPDPLAGFRMTLLRMLAFVPGPASTPPAPPAPRFTTTPSTSTPIRPASNATAPSLPATTITTAPSPVAPVHTTMFDGNWFTLSQRLNGGLKQLASQCELVSHDAQSLSLRIPESARPLLGSLGSKLTLALRDLLGTTIKIDIQIGATQGSAPAEVLTRQKNERQSTAEAAIYADPTVQTLMRDFDAAVIDISPLNKV